MADTNFIDLSAVTDLQATDQILVVRNGAAYRFTGTMVALANGTLGIPVLAATKNVRGGILVAQGTPDTSGCVGDSFRAVVAGNGLAISQAYNHTSGSEIALGLYGTSVTLRAGGNSVATASPNGFLAGVDASYMLGGPSNRWTNIYATNGAISTSDAHAKQGVGAVPDEWLDAWAEVEWIRYRFNDAVEKKGDAARWHIGLIAQQVRDVFAARGIDAMMIGLLCYDEWDASDEVPGTPEVRGVEGELVMPAYPATPAREAGSRYGLRYDECQAIEAAYQRRAIARAAGRERALEDRLAAMEASLATRA